MLSSRSLLAEPRRLSGAIGRRTQGMGQQRPRTLMLSSERHTPTRISSNSIPCQRPFSRYKYQERSLMNIYRSLTPSNSRPQTPPSSSKSSTRHATQSPPPRANSILSSPAKRPMHPQSISQTTDAWDEKQIDEDDGDDGAEEYYYNDGADEDEFGLPSITSTRREAKRRIPISKINDPGGVRLASSNGTSAIPSGRPRANSSDIGDERGPPSYPTVKKTEGKILRPQYKDILRGMSP